QVRICFFSSTRRHTRFSRDWSSDVCSSDLMLGSLVTFGKIRWVHEPGLYHVIVHFRSERAMRRLLCGAVELVEALLRPEPFDPRSEERRVGKECRPRVHVYHCERHTSEWSR